MRSGMGIGFALFTGLCLSGNLGAQDAPFDFRKAIQDISVRCEAARDYLFEGGMEVSGQRGSQPARLLAKGKIKLAVSDPGKYFLRVEAVNQDEYMLVSDGQKSWAYVPKLKQYTEQESATVTNSDDDEESNDDGFDAERNLTETFARLVIPTLAKLAKTAAMADTKGSAEVKFGGKKQSWPVVRVVSRDDGQGGRNRV